MGGGNILALTYLVIEYVRPASYVPAFAYLRPGYVLGGLAVLYLVALKRRPLPIEGWILLAHVACLAASGILSPVPGKVLEVWRGLLTMIISGSLVFMVALDTLRSLRIACWIYVLIGSASALSSLVGSGHGLGGFFVDENDLSMQLCTVFPIAIRLGLSSRRAVARFAGITGATLCVGGIVSSFSRGGFLGLVAVGLYLLAASGRKLVAIVSVLLILLVTVPLLQSAWVDEMLSIQSATEKGDTGEKRLYMWGVAWRVFLDRPVFGVGPGAYPRVAPFYESNERTLEGVHLWGQACHSVYFTLLAEGGILGTFTWLLALYLCQRRRRGPLPREPSSHADLDRYDAERRSVQIGIRGALIGFLTTGAFLTVNYYPNVWTLIGLASAARSAGPDQLGEGRDEVVDDAPIPLGKVS